MSTQRLLFTIFISAIVLSMLTNPLHAQEQDTTRVILGTADSVRIDSTKIVEDAALDIPQNRGFFIISPDGRLQLRILGSVRYLAVYDTKKLESKNGFKTTEIPVGADDIRQPSIYNGLEQTRIGFEVTRKTKKGNVFVRLETDFAGNEGYRIRHAYGQYGRFLIGQTWSLFTHITSIPATADFNGPTGSVTARTPQIRYTMKRKILGNVVSVGLEYFRPDFELPDTLAVESFQLIPDITGRLEQRTNWGTFQITGLVTVLSGREDDGSRPEYILGWGGAFSAIIDSWASGKWYMNVTGGQGVTRYFNDLSGQGFDLLIDPDNGAAVLPHALGTFLTYEHSWTENIFSSFTYGAMVLEELSFTPEDSYRWGDSFRVNTFWSIVDGARAGLEYIYGVRNNKDKQSGTASRINLLFYYDF